MRPSRLHHEAADASMEDLSQSLSILKNLAFKYDAPLPPGEAGLSRTAPSKVPLTGPRGAVSSPAKTTPFPGPRGTPGKGTAVVSGRGGASPARSSQKLAAKPPWCPARAPHSAAQRPLSPGRRSVRTEESILTRAERCVVSGEGARVADLKKEARFTIWVRDEQGMSSAPRHSPARLAGLCMLLHPVLKWSAPRERVRSSMRPPSPPTLEPMRSLQENQPTLVGSVSGSSFGAAPHPSWSLST